MALFHPVDLLLVTDVCCLARMLYLLSFVPVEDSSFADEVEEGVDVVWPDPVIHCSHSWLLSSVSLMIDVFRCLHFVRLLPLLTVELRLDISLLFLSDTSVPCGGDEPLELFDVFVNVVSGYD